MDNQSLQELLDAVQAQGGGLVLKQGDAPKAVVLSVPKYQDLLAASKAQAPAPADNSDNNNASDAAAPKENTEPPKPEPKLILVTGGAGYIGAHLVRRLLEVGQKVVILDNLSTGKKENIPSGVEFVEGDVRDVELVKATLEKHKVDAIMHLAALLEVEESTQKPDEYFDVNVKGTLSLLEAARQAGVKNIIFSSTAAVYGAQDIVPIPESAPTNPADPYGTTKLLAEQLTAYYSEFLNLNVTILRYFNVCGAVENWNISDPHASHLLPVVMEAASGKRDKITVNGSDYPTHDGTAVRDYVHALDIANAHIAILENGANRSFRVYNIGTGRGFSVKEIISMASEITGRMIPMEIGPRRAGNVAITVADNRLIKDELGFVPEHSSLENILKSAWQMAQSAKRPSAKE